MVYLNGFDLLEGDIYRVRTINMNPEGLDTSKGVLIEALPVANETKGERSILHYNKATKKAFYINETVPLERDEEVETLKKQVADLAYELMMLKGAN